MAVHHNKIRGCLEYLQQEVLEIAQKLIGMAAEWCSWESVVTKKWSVDAVVSAVQPGSRLYPFCTALAGNING
jgi:hypothetical protein